MTPSAALRLLRALVPTLVLAACAATPSEVDRDTDGPTRDTDGLPPTDAGGDPDSSGAGDIADTGGSGDPADAGSGESDVDPDADADALDLDAPTPDGSGSDASDADIDPADADADGSAPTPVECATADVWTGVLVEDINGGTLNVGDVVRITVEVLGTASASTPAWVQVEHSNLRVDAASFTRDGAAFTPTVVGPFVTVSQAGAEPELIRYQATVQGSDGLVAVFAAMLTLEDSCEIPRSRSGAFFQIAGGETKTPVCIDMAAYRSMQVAPAITRQNTQAWQTLNGRRDDLRAQDFIFCPQSPTIVHESEFCLERAADQDISFAGSYKIPGRWEVDDFVLVEVFAGGTTRDGFTTQRHTGAANRFYCNETRTQLCTTDCTARLVEVAGGRAITPLATVTAEGPTARQHVDGEVSIVSLLPASGTADVRITALDTGVEGTLSPALYLISDAP
jgi:hypothetical protein